MAALEGTGEDGDAEGTDAASELMDAVERLIAAPTPTATALATVNRTINRLNSVGQSTRVDREVADYAQYMAALAQLCLGNFDRADQHLQALNLRFRLSTEVWAALGRAPEGEAGLPAAEGVAGAARVWEEAVPVAVLETLRRGLARGSSFWSDHCYESDAAKFFSYHYALSDEPRNAVESCVQLLWATLNGTPGFEQVEGVEWWAHKRSTGESWVAGCHQLHFDTDEATFEPQSGQRLRHPRVSSVLYLSECGGPTLVTDKTPGSAGLGARGALVWPDPGRLLMFSGNALHGVLPSCQSFRDSGSSSSESGMGDRLTLIIAWWDGGARPRDNPGGFGPLQRTPDQASGWQKKELPPILPPPTPPVHRHLPRFPRRKAAVVDPLWEAVGESEGRASAVRAEPSTSSTLPPLRIFVQHEDAFERVYEEAAVAVYWEQELGL